MCGVKETTNQPEGKRPMIAHQNSQVTDIRKAISSLRVVIMDANDQKKNAECSLNDQLTYGNIAGRCDAVIKFLESLEK
jgi:hypothetical protein